MEWDVVVCVELLLPFVEGFIEMGFPENGRMIPGLFEVSDKTGIRSAQIGHGVVPAFGAQSADWHDTRSVGGPVPTVDVLHQRSGRGRLSWADRGYPGGAEVEKRAERGGRGFEK